MFCDYHAEDRDRGMQEAPVGSSYPITGWVFIRVWFSTEQRHRGAEGRGRWSAGLLEPVQLAEAMLLQLAVAQLLILQVLGKMVLQTILVSVRNRAAREGR